MPPFDLYNLPIRQDDPAIWEQHDWASSPPAIVQIVEDPRNYHDLDDISPWMLEITLNEAGAIPQVERYVSENGAVVKIDHHAALPSEENSLSEKLDKIKSQLGIGIKHLASALGVERPTVYAWIKGTRHPQPKRWERIQSLSELADHWQKLSQHPLSRRIFVPVDAGRSVMDLLASDRPDSAMIKKVLDSLAIDENNRSTRLKAKAINMREQMKAKGVKPLSENVVNQSMRNLSNW